MTTDPKFIRWLESRGFHPNERIRPGYTVSGFIGRIADPQGVGHEVRLWFNYSWRNDEINALPKRVQVEADNAPTKAYIKLVGKHKLIVHLDEAVQAAIVLAKLYNRITEAKLLKTIATTMLDGEPFANAEYLNNPRRTPEARPGPENP